MTRHHQSTYCYDCINLTQIRRLLTCQPSNFAQGYMILFIIVIIIIKHMAMVTKRRKKSLANVKNSDIQKLSQNTLLHNITKQFISGCYYFFDVFAWNSIQLLKNEIILMFLHDTNFGFRTFIWTI